MDGDVVRGIVSSDAVCRLDTLRRRPSRNCCTPTSLSCRNSSVLRAPTNTERTEVMVNCPRSSSTSSEPTTTDRPRLLLVRYLIPNPMGMLTPEEPPRYCRIALSFMRETGANTAFCYLPALNPDPPMIMAV
jgi:hypothetical protein